MVNGRQRSPFLHRGKAVLSSCWQAVIAHRSSVLALLLIVILVPWYTITIVLVLRSGLLANSTASGLSNEQFRAVLTFLAAVFATTVTTVGLLLTKAHNDHVHTSQQLEIATKGLDLMVSGDKYAPQARVAGALAVLVHLQQPVIAIRSLRTAWFDEAVDIETAVWLIGEVLLLGNETSQSEAARLLEERAILLVDGKSASTGRFHWPPAIYERWLPGIPIGAKIAIIATMQKMLLARDISWWKSIGYRWIITLLDEVLNIDKDEGIRNAAADMLQILLPTLTSQAKNIAWRSSWKSVASIKKRIEGNQASSVRILKLVELQNKIAIWTRPNYAMEVRLIIRRTVRRIILRRNRRLHR